MNSNYVPEWDKTPFDHMEYTLARNQDQFDLLFENMSDSDKFLDMDADCCVSFYGNDSHAIVQLGNCVNMTIMQIHSLLLHEAVHIWQRLKRKMGEHEPSKEFEAYSIQRIAQDLFYMFEASEGT